MSAGMRMGCRGCGAAGLTRVLDLGKMPAADDFPPLDAPCEAGDTTHPLAMDLCPVCGLAQLAEDDTVIEKGDVKVIMDSQSAPLLQGAEVDYVDSVQGSGFSIKNPQAKTTCGCGSSFSA